MVEGAEKSLQVLIQVCKQLPAAWEGSAATEGCLAPDEPLKQGEPSSPSFLAQDQLLPPMTHFLWHQGTFLTHQTMEAAAASTHRHL